MIERYSRPEMKKVWSDESKFDKWLQVEIAVCEAWAELGAIPRDAIPKIKKARFDLKRIDNFWLRLKFNQYVKTSGFLLNRIGKLSQAPILLIHNLSFTVLYNLFEFVDSILYLSLR